MFRSIVGKFLILSTVLVLVMPGCSQQESNTELDRSEAAEDVVKARVLARWKVLMSGDIETAYSFASPSSREIMSLERYRLRLNPGLWRDAVVESVDCNGNSCKVNILVTVDIKGIPGSVTQPLSEKWVYDEGDWWYVILI